MDTVHDFYWYWMCNITGIGNSKIRKLLQIYHTPKGVYQASDESLGTLDFLKAIDIYAIQESKKDSGLYEEFIHLGRKNISFVNADSVQYPDRLKRIYDYPYGLFFKGKMLENTKPSVAIVGARKCSLYGKKVAYEFAKAFAQMGIQVVSGMATGIDTAAHRGCLDGGGQTYAVLGSGVDVCYPAENIELYTNIEETGGIISEYPLKTQPSTWTFPLRNRIISGLADAVILVEAGKKSGSLITADQALEQNRDIYVIPGRITDAMSVGCNNLIKQGAQLILKPEDIWENPWIAQMKNDKIKDEKCQKNTQINTMSDNKKFQQKDTKDKKQLASPQDMLYSCFDLYPKSIDAIAKETGMDIAELNQQIVELMLMGRIEEVSKSCYVKVLT